MSNGDLMQNKINIVALAAGISTLLLIVISIFAPWWQLVVGNPSIATVNISPVNLNLALLGNSLTAPLFLAINIAVALTLAAGSITMLIYSVKPNKPYSMKLLGFGYKKPLYAVITFVIGLFVMSMVIQKFSGLSIPLLGSGAISLPNNMIPAGAKISVDVSAAFGWPFYFAIVVAGLCIAARFYHQRVVANTISIPNTPITK
jgi:hypothetical protein